MEPTRPSGVRFQHKNIIVQSLWTAVAVVVVEVVLLLLSPWMLGLQGWQVRLIVAAVVALVVGALIGGWVNRSWHQRLERLAHTTQAWLRGTLDLRVGDFGRDELGLLAGQLDTLAEHLEQDEQDLARLREQSTRATDQVRALAVDEERERLARELHDGVKQHLFSLSMTSSALRARLEGQDTGLEVAEMVREVETTSKMVQRSLTRLIEDLRPAPLQEQGLEKALNDYTLLFGAREHILVYLDAQGNDALLPPSVAEALYRVAQEALHNIARHARATRVDVRLSCFPEQVTLELRDNGTGFDVAQTRTGLGLGNMQDRMVSVGGRLEIHSAVGSGTRIRAEVRLTMSREAHPGIASMDRDRPRLTVENWSWLGQRLVIPVGQTWPWLPADQVHLRRPVVDPGTGPVLVDRRRGPLLIRERILLQDQRGVVLAQIRHHRWGYEWRADGVRWALQHVRGPRGTMRVVLVRNKQPLAAMQHQGRLLSTWSEIIFDGAGYGLACSADTSGECALVDGAGEPVLSISGYKPAYIALQRPVALPLLVMAAVRVLEERGPSREITEPGS